MPSVQEATDALRTALQEKGVESHVQDAFDSLASCLVLLNSSSPSVQMIRKLCTVLRQPFLPLYKACLRPALQLASSILSTVLGKLCDAQNTEDRSLRAAWDTTAEVIMSGILDFLDQKDGGNAELGGAVWEVLYRVICEFFFLDFGRGLPAFSIPLCLSAYNTLTETAARGITIRNALRQRAVLGGERLGVAISGTRDYLPLEALLVLFARLLPPTSQGKIRRIKFVKEVLGSPKLFKCSVELLNIMQKTSDIHWDDVAAQIVDVLARSDITYPQPFATDEIHVCERVFPQPLATDRLIVDRQAFFANIVVENNDICESLQVPYSRIRKITLDNPVENVPRGKVLITVYLAAPPLIANVEMKSPDASHLHAKFLLQNTAVSTFMEALRRRGVGKLSFLSPLTRVDRKRKSISIGSGFRFTKDSSPIPPTASFEGKVQHVNKVYKTNTEDATTFQTVPMSRVVDAGSLNTFDPKPPFKDEDRTLEAPASTIPKDVPTTHKSIRLDPPTNQGSKPIQKHALPCLPWKSAGTALSFGDSDELSEISEFEVDNNTGFERSVPEPSLSDNYGLKSTQHQFDCMRPENPISIFGKSVQPSEPALKPAEDRGAAQKSSGTGKLFLTSDSPMFGVTSSTQVDVSPKPLPNSDTLLPTIDTEVDCRLVTSQVLVDADTLKGTGKLSAEPSYVTSELGQHITRSSSTKREGYPHIKIDECTSTPLKIAGSRRKRESVRSSCKPINKDIDDEYTPPCKRSRRDRIGVEDKAKSNETSSNVTHLSRAKGYTKTANRPSPTTDLKAVNAGPKSTYHGTRRSSRIRKRQAAITDRGRPNATCGKTQGGKQVVCQSASGVERRNLETTLMQDTSTGIVHRRQKIRNSRPITPVVKESPFPETDDQTSCVELGNAECIAAETRLTQRMLEGNSIIVCPSGQLSGAQDKGPRVGFGFVHESSLDATQLDLEEVHHKDKETVHDQHLAPEVHSMDEEANVVPGDIVHPVSLEERENILELSQPMENPILQTEIVTIDLTRDDSPIRGSSELYEASVDPVRLEVDVHSKPSTPPPPDGITLEELVFNPSLRHKRRNVSFASPIEYVLDSKSRREVNSSSRQPLLISESSPLSPLRVPRGTANVRSGSPGRISPRVPSQNSNTSQGDRYSYGLTDNSAHSNPQASVRDETAGDVGIQDIIEVLDEIHAVIIKGVSDKFKNIRKGVQRSRDELVQQVLDELRGMVIENANYFNGLLRLEENYYKNCKALICCWEELIDRNDDIAAQFQNTLKQHNEITSVKIFPKTLLPTQLVLPRRRTSAR